MPEFIFNGTPEQLASVFGRLKTQHDPVRLMLSDDIDPSAFVAKIMTPLRYVIWEPNSQQNLCEIVAAIRPDGKTRVSTERVDGDWSQFESSWQILTDELERDGWIGEAPDPAPVVDDELTKDRKFYNWAYVEIYLKGENPDDVFDSYLKYVLGVDLFDLDASQADRLRNNFDSAMSTRKAKYGG